MIYPTDDTYQKVAKGEAAYGSENTMRIRYSTLGDWRFDGYLKFDIAGLDINKVKSAKIKLSSSTSIAGDPISLTIYKCNNEWTESTLLSANKPAIVGGGLDIVSFAGTDLWSYFDVTNQLKSELQGGNQTVSFVIRAGSGNTENVYFNTKEADNEALRPALAVEEIVPTTDVAAHPSGDINFRFADKKLFLAHAGEVHTRIFDLSGKTVLSETAINTNSIDLSGLPAGVYVASLQADQQHKILKIILND